ncbi:MAG: hypothetical protein Unbinned3338contig1000_34 [Prokaryotic dsDNA virus sp.]|nr:MAG: hypothetical protein Unbinned3338contig1000_34 [Prokaryotic dsDNA virus sp.]|tara:strand:+ start:3975 stop:4166 length:192 start_codon:yes stop_codon:yes gene_type:complete
MINDMENIEDVVLLFDQVFGKDDIVGEKDFFEFMKRANRDLTAKQRYIILRITINALRGANDE